jgi:hypothetical protein
MDPARSLHSVFTDLTGERDHAAASGLRPDEVLAAGGHPDLPEGLVAEAVVNYADTAPYEVAEHLAPFVRANSAVPQPSEGTGEPEPHWYDLLTTAPSVVGLTGTDALDAEAGVLAAPEPALDAGDAVDSAGADAAVNADAGDVDAGFGQGHRGPAEQLPAGGEAGDSGEAVAPWSVATPPAIDSAGSEGLELGPDLDFGPQPGDPTVAPGDEIDPIGDA